MLVSLQYYMLIHAYFSLCNFLVGMILVLFQLLLHIYFLFMPALCSSIVHGMVNVSLFQFFFYSK